MLRSAEGDLVFAFCKQLGDHDVMMAEALALSVGLLMYQKRVSRILW